MLRMDSNSHISEVCPPEESGRRRLVNLGAQTQEDPVDPTVLDEDLEVGSDHSSDTESIDTRGGTSDAVGEAEVVSVPEAPVSRGCKISNAFGSSWCSVRVRGATISCAPCLPALQHRTRKAMIKGMQATMATLLEGIPGDASQQRVASQLATLPMRMGGLGSRSAARIAPAAYWASWGDALHMIQRRLSQIAHSFIHQVENGGADGCVGELQNACVTLDRSGFVGRPSWAQLRSGARPPPVERAEPGEWQHGWQYYASSSLEYHFREIVVLAQSVAADQAHLRSHSGPGASEVLCCAPTKSEFKMQPDVFRTVILERLRLPLDITNCRCECGGSVDNLGRHRAACPRSGRLRTRAVVPERTLARVCREAGAVVRRNVKLRDMNTTVLVNDAREIEVLASGLPMHRGAQLAVDITLRSAITASGEACPNAAAVNGAVLHRARRDKETKYAELVEVERCRLVVVPIETGGRWGDEAVRFIE